MELDREQLNVLKEIAGIDGAPEGAYNIRVDGKSVGSSSTKEIDIKFHGTGNGMDITVAPGTVRQNVHIPVILSASGHVETVYNNFFIGENADITIVAGCGVHNCGSGLSQHDGVHTFHLGKNARVKYVEKHYGSEESTGEIVLNPVTEAYLGEGSFMEMNTIQIRGVNSTRRVTRADIGAGASLVIKEKLMTHDRQQAVTEFEVNLNGKGSSADVASRSVASGSSRQVFLSKMSGNEECAGHSECDAIIMDAACVQAIPEVTANHVEAMLIHEAAIGKIAGEQITKLMTLGLDREEAERQIVKGFLK
ncbi:MAG: SufD family Fe-S cluster assembly protein [Oscillospiraceae bacterium]|jgi:Fe-S cluster assembly scaffold protein SufB|nr:SufD family Fe-S cluster assembly protein [Oscillospiraceae bacterium]